MQEVQDMLAQLQGQHDILVSALKRKHVSTMSWFPGHLCRMTGYTNTIESVEVEEAGPS